MNITITQDNTRNELLGANGAQIIHKLYELAVDGNNTLTLSGSINSSSAYEDDVDYLNTEYGPDLIVNSTKKYLAFEDPLTQLACAEFFGDGVGVTKALLLELTQYNPQKDGVYFFERLNQLGAKKFNEFRYFTNCPTSFGSYVTSYTTHRMLTIEELTLPPQLVTIEDWCFYGCTNLRMIHIPHKLNYVGDRGMCLNTQLGYNSDGTLNGLSFDWSNITGYFGQYTFSRGITGDIVLKSGIWSSPANFFLPINATKIVFPSDFNCTGFNIDVELKGVNQKLIFLGVTPISNYDSDWPTSWRATGTGTRTYYCPDSVVSDYTTKLGNRNWQTLSTYANISEANKDELISYGCTVTGSSLGNYVVKAPNEL